MTRLADLLHRAAHRLDRHSLCRCRADAYMQGWRARRDMELRQIGLPSSPDELDEFFRRVIADSERGVA